MKKNEETLNGQIGETLTLDKGTELIKREPIEGTPFEVVRTTEGDFVAIGTYRITEIYEDIYKKSMQIEDIQNNVDWNFLINVIFAVMDMRDKMKYGKGILSSGQSEDNI